MPAPAAAGVVDITAVSGWPAVSAVLREQGWVPAGSSFDDGTSLCGHRIHVDGHGGGWAVPTARRPPRTRAGSRRVLTPRRVWC